MIIRIIKVIRVITTIRIVTVTRVTKVYRVITRMMLSPILSKLKKPGCESEQSIMKLPLHN